MVQLLGIFPFAFFLSPCWSRAGEVEEEAQSQGSQPSVSASAGRPSVRVDAPGSCVGRVRGVLRLRPAWRARKDGVSGAEAGEGQVRQYFGLGENSGNQLRGSGGQPW